MIDNVPHRHRGVPVDYEEMLSLQLQQQNDVRRPAGLVLEGDG